MNTSTEKQRTPGQRYQYEMSEQELADILEACKPVPAIFLSGGRPMFGTTQENANRAWAALGKKMGFDAMSVRPVYADNPRVFTAIATNRE